ncbi:MAG: accessory gene regulator B family protein [Oscillospiraceae bacterium]
MITNIAAKIADWLIKGGSIEKDEKDLYQYGLFFFLTALVFLLSATILGAIFGVLLGSFIFFMSFFVIRQFAGGYHAKTETRCQFLSLISISLSIFILGMLKGTTPIPLLIISNAFAIVIFLLSPVDTAERELSAEEIKVFRKISQIVISLLICSTNLAFFWIKPICSALCIAICLEGILLSSAFLKKAVLKCKKQPVSQK